MLHAIVPLAAVLAAVRVSVRALAMLLVVAVVAFVSAAVLPHVDAVAMHDAVLEGALEVAAVRPLEAAEPTHLVLAPHACVLRTIRPEVAAFALLDTLSEESVVVAAIGPDLDSLPITLLLLAGQLAASLQLLKVLRHILSLILAEYAEVGKGIILPESFIRLTAWFWCTEDTHADGLTVDPVTLEVRAIWPDKLAVATSSIFVVDNSLLAVDAAVW